jgi:hypothetical protein
MLDKRLYEVSPDNYYTQFYHPFCEQAQQLIPYTGGAILPCSKST